jgi:hypothetical protein
MKIKGSRKMRSQTIKHKLSVFGCAVLLATGSLCAGLWSTQAQAQAPAQKPNILFIMGDDIAGCSRASTTKA